MRVGIAIVVLAMGGLLVGTSTAQAPVTETITAEHDQSLGFKWVQGTHPNKINVGDVLLASDALKDPSSGNRIGAEGFACTVYFGKVGKSRNMLCTDQITLRGRGQLEAQGVIHLGNAPVPLAIVGAT